MSIGPSPGQCPTCGQFLSQPVGYYGQGMVPHRCPVCNGHGVVSYPKGIAADQESFTSSSPGPWPCRACDGSGVLWR